MCVCVCVCVCVCMCVFVCVCVCVNKMWWMKKAMHCGLTEQSIVW